MRLILSRKGFDSSPAYGACASPILPDGRMVSLPIPHKDGTVRFSSLRPRGLDLGRLVSDLSGGRVPADSRSHLDPDLDSATCERANGWRPAFGQDSAAQRHLERMGVAVGDIFLFFGWFREVVKVQGRYRYRPSAPDLHVMFGWLRIGQILRLGTDAVPPWLATHPHAARDCAPHNTVYVAMGRDDGGIFSTFDPTLQLTDPASPLRSVWRLPADFQPGTRRALTYHGDPLRWSGDNARCLLRTVAKGQEFVLDLDEYPGVREWAAAIVDGHSAGS